MQEDATPNESPQGQCSDTEEPTQGGYVGIGSGLDWTSPLVEISLRVELPFRLLVPTEDADVPLGGSTVPISIINDGIEIQHGTEYTRRQYNTLYSGSKKALREVPVPVAAVTEGGSWRYTNTQLVMRAFAIEDAVAAFFGPDTPRYQDGFRYFASLATGYLTVVNAAVNAYRRAAVDPYAHEVTESDVPNWFVHGSGMTRPVCLSSFHVQDQFPHIFPFGRDEDPEPYFAATNELFQEALSDRPRPGEVEILDGWSLFHSGRFGDSIRSFVTAIEVLLEAEIRRLSTEQGKQEQEIDKTLERTRNNFDDRLTEYCRLSRRRVPGPKLHPVPYINGKRLWDELAITRRLRHRIVHHGHRLDPSFRGPMLRAAETTSWLFDWLAHDSGFEQRRCNNHVYFFGNRISSNLFDWEEKDGVISVVPPVLPGSDELEVDAEEAPAQADERGNVHRGVPVMDGEHLVYSPEFIFSKISDSVRSGKDLEHFAKLAFYEFGLGEIEDGPFPIEDEPSPERFSFEFEGRRVAVFLLDNDHRFGTEDVKTIAEQVECSRRHGRSFDHSIVIGNVHGADWRARSAPLPEEVSSLAAASRISVLQTWRLAKVVWATVDHGWSRLGTVRELLQGGEQGFAPPSAKRVGEVYHVWDGSRILGVLPATNSDVAKGDMIAVEAKDEFLLSPLEDTRLDQEGRLTIKTKFVPCKAFKGMQVYALDPEASFEAVSDEQESEEGELWERNQCFAHRAVHPHQM